MLRDNDRKPGPKPGSDRRGFGRIRTERSGRISAGYTHNGVLYRADTTFEDRDAAIGWLNNERRNIDRGDWLPPDQRDEVVQPKRTQPFSTYAAAWLDGRVIKGRTLKPRTRTEYERLLAKELEPTFGKLPLTAISRDMVNTWHAGQGSGTRTQTARAYSLLRTIFASAVDDGLIGTNPCRIRGAGNVTRAHKVTPLTLDELAVLVEAMPDKYRVMVLLAAWCALRFGELAELRRKDIDLTNGRIKVRRGVVRADGEVIVGTPKSDAGARDVAIPPHLLPLVKTHLAVHAQPGRDGLLFPAVHGGQLAPSTLYGKNPTRVKLPDGSIEWRGGTNFYKARAIAGRPGLHFHDLRHTGAVLAAQTGATLAELMGRLGHSTPAAALRYQHAAQDRDKAIAEALSRMAGA